MKRQLKAAAIALILLAGLVAQPPTSTVPAEIVRVIDGDTIRVEADPWPNWSWTGSVRIDGIDTPELRGRCPEERQAARAARDFIRKLPDKDVTLYDVKLGKYAGRIVAGVTLSDGSYLSDRLLNAGLARKYDGGKRRGWCGPGDLPNGERE